MNCTKYGCGSGWENFLIPKVSTQNLPQRIKEGKIKLERPSMFLRVVNDCWESVSGSCRAVSGNSLRVWQYIIRNLLEFIFLLHNKLFPRSKTNPQSIFFLYLNRCLMERMVCKHSLSYTFYKAFHTNDRPLEEIYRNRQ